jgi:hypothetical protein
VDLREVPSLLEQGGARAVAVAAVRAPGEAMAPELLAAAAAEEVRQQRPQDRCYPLIAASQPH